MRTEILVNFIKAYKSGEERFFDQAVRMIAEEMLQEEKEEDAQAVLAALNYRVQDDRPFSYGIKNNTRG